MCLAGGKRHDSQSRDDRAIRGVKTDMQGIRDRKDRQRACELSYERRILPLRYCAMRGWQGPHAVIVIGGFGQLSAEILAERGGAHKTLMRRSNRNKNVRRGSGEPYRHPHFGVPPCANMRGCSPHVVRVPAVSMVIYLINIFYGL